MKTVDIAPCGINCSLCLAFQRVKDTCAGCNGSNENKRKSCVVCMIKNCEEKKGKERLLCNKCKKYPCRRIKHLHKRYSERYNVNIYENFNMIKEEGIKEFIGKEREKWKCIKCGNLFCMHREKCLVCGNENTILREIRNNPTPASTL